MERSMTVAENAKTNTRCGGAGHDHSHRHDHGDHHHSQAAAAGTKIPDLQQYSYESASSAGISERAVYTCPMHPEYHQISPGNCPICGMALEPEVVTLDSPPHSRTRGHDPSLPGGARASTATPPPGARPSSGWPSCRG